MAPRKGSSDHNKQYIYSEQSYMLFFPPTLTESANHFQGPGQQTSVISKLHPSMGFFFFWCVWQKVVVWCMTHEGGAHISRMSGSTPEYSPTPSSFISFTNGSFGRDQCVKQQWYQISNRRMKWHLAQSVRQHQRGREVPDRWMLMGCRHLSEDRLM